MRRRDFLGALAAGTGTAVAGSPAHAAGAPAVGHAGPSRRDFAVDGHRIRFHRTGSRGAFKVCFIADTHLFRDDARGESFRPYSARMAKAYNTTRHFQTGEPTNPEAGMDWALEAARKEEAAFVALVGDIVSFPSEAAIEWVRQRMAATALPWLYVAGNHDWHYEGMTGSLAHLREKWIQERLLPLYQGRDPMMTAYDIQGVRFVALDNSTNEIDDRQLRFFRAQVRSRRPMVLLVHIPLYVPGRPLGFGCGHPEWGARNDRNWELERRERWPEAGHTRTTRAFVQEVFAAPNLIAVFAGHTHKASIDLAAGVPQFVTDANATAGHLMLEFLP